MKCYTQILPFVALTTAFVIPDEQLTTQILLETTIEQSTTVQDVVPQVSNEETFPTGDIVTYGENALDDAFSWVTDPVPAARSTFECLGSMTTFDAESWIDSSSEESFEDAIYDGYDDDNDDNDEYFPSYLDADRPRRKPAIPCHQHDKNPTQTVYELIASSKYTTRLAELINSYPDLVATLNQTTANFTVFAPTDKAFEKIPKGHGKPSKEVIKKILAHHVSPDFYPASRVLVSHTIPTIFGEDALGGAQRLRVGVGLRGLTVNFYSRIVAINIFGTNGVIHGVDSLLLPPPPALKIIELLPTHFSTLQLALIKTGLLETLKTSEHIGGTLFAPSNAAFSRLGPKANAFLFSPHGQKYLAALLKYHVVPLQTLYSDAYYSGQNAMGCHLEIGAVAALEEEEGSGVPKGRYHVDLPTLLGDQSLSIDVARWGGFISMRINGFTSVQVQDGIAKDGVIHALGSVLLPPRKPRGEDDAALFWEGEELQVEDLIERLEPYVDFEDIEDL